MNQIIRSYLNEHVAEYGISSYSEDEAFEHFMNKCIVSRYSVDRFDPGDVMTDEGEIGLDGIAILINQQMVLSVEEAAELMSSMREVKVDFVFIQTKNKEHFEDSEMSQFAKGVRYFFQNAEERPKTNESIENLVRVKDYIYAHISDQEHRPYLSLYYVCCGRWSEETNLSSTVKLTKKDFEDTGDFEDVEYYPFDQENIRQIYKEMRRKVQKTFLMEKHMAFPPMQGIKVAYFGLIRCRDLVGLINDEGGYLYPNIFEDNVRDFQGYNPVNTEIQTTIRDAIEQQRFAILNNGITIIAGNVEFNGDEVTIFDYQIVNGCQTSRVLSDNSASLKDNAYVSAKIIQVADENILDSIVFTTNRQTEVKYEAFVASKPFHKKLQEYYNSTEPQYRLYYERRSKQYDMDAKIQKTKIITLAVQTNAYVAMFLNEPQSVHRYYGELLQNYSSRLYGEQDSVEAYYAAAYYYYHIDEKIKNGTLDKKYIPYKYQLCYILRGLIGDTCLYNGNTRKLQKIANELIRVSRDEAEFNRKLNTACTILNDSLEEYRQQDQAALTENGNTPDRSRKLTEILTKHIRQYTKEVQNTHFLKKGDTVQCLVDSINNYAVSVTLKTEDERNKGSIHIRNVGDFFVRDLNDYFRLGQIIEAKIISDDFVASGYGWSLSTKETMRF